MVKAESFHEAAADPSDTQGRLCMAAGLLVNLQTCVGVVFVL